jgi:glycine cleavage system H protein
MDFANTRFSKDHEWIKSIDGSGNEVLMPEVGAEFNSGDTIGTIEAVKTVADLYAPVSGTVAEVNQQLEDQPEVINSSPYEEGWFIKVTMSDPSEMESLMSHDAYQEMIGEA